MTTPLPPQEPEKLPGEAELAALYRKLPQAEPGPALDQAVLRAAAQALADEGRQAPAESPARRRPRWPIAWGSAAALVLAAGLAWHMREMPEAAAPATQGASTDATHQGAPPAPVADAESLPSPSLPLPPARQVATPAKPHEQARKAIVRPAAKPQVMRQAMAPPRPVSPPVEETVQPAPAPPPAVAPALVLPAPPPAPAAPPAPPATITSFAAEGPVAELQTIRELFAAGRDKEGRERLVRFREVHPDWPLPDDLRARLPKP
jgi:hypothetical protein